MKREMEQQLLQNQREMEEMKKSWQERLSEQEAANKAKEEQEKKEKELRKTTPHFWNLNEDSQLSGKIHHLIKPGNSHYGLKLRTEHSQVFAGFKEDDGLSSSLQCFFFLIFLGNPCIVN